MSISLELLIIAGLILANGFFAAAEVAVLTARRNRLEQQARSQNRSAQRHWIWRPIPGNSCRRSRWELP